MNITYSNPVYAQLADILSLEHENNQLALIDLLHLDISVSVCLQNIWHHAVM